MLQTLSQLQPVILLVMLVVMYNLERWMPYLNSPQNKRRHDGQNLILTLISFIVNGALSILVVGVLEWTQKNQWGLLHLSGIPQWMKVIAGIFLIDLGGYLFHNLQHKAPILWRFHRVHHSDPYLNATSSLRFHPLDVVLAQGLFPCLWIPLMGITMTSFILYGTLALPLLILQHSNYKMPGWVEKYGRLLFSTPGWHKIHHSDEQALTDSHYGDVFTFWDRIFGTWKPVRPEEIQYGLKEFSREDQHRAGYLLKSPFIKLDGGSS